MAATGSVTVQSALTAACTRIDPLDARVLMTSLLGRDASYLIAHGEEVLTSDVVARYEDWVRRRATGEPVAYIVGWREFYGRRFAVMPAVLIPRPETELVVDVVLPLLPAWRAPRILDLGTGSGCLALTFAAEYPGARITAVDVSPAALQVARANAAALGIGQVTWVQSDWFEGLAGQRYHVAVANPPYIAAGDAHLAEGDLRFEPRAALTPGPDGLGAIRCIVHDAPRHLEPGGWLWFEHGYDQGEACRALLEAAGYSDVATHRDLSGSERVSGGRRPPGVDAAGAGD